MIIFLDSGPLWLVVNPKGGVAADELRKVLKDRAMKGDTLAVAEICNYETRRELVRKAATKQLANLDAFIAGASYHPITTPLIHAAAQLWATLRNAGGGTAPPEALDADVILAAEAQKYADHVVLTFNAKHLSRVCKTADVAALAALP